MKKYASSIDRIEDSITIDTSYVAEVIRKRKNK